MRFFIYHHSLSTLHSPPCGTASSSVLTHAESVTATISNGNNLQMCVFGFIFIVNFAF